jgi:hypothetical protein
MTGTVVKLKTLRHRMLIWQIGSEPTVESYQLSQLLGYKQSSSLRKQTLTDWKDWMIGGTDYIMVHDEKEMRWYEKTQFALLGDMPVPVEPSRGYLMFTGAGVAKVMERTTKANAPAFVEDTKHIFSELDDTPKPEIKAEDRKFHYEVLQTLLKQLQEFKEPAMREVAITAAEAATGKDFSDLRATFQVKAPAPAPAPPKAAAVKLTITVSPDPAPLFIEDGFYSLKAIGEKAGGYSPGTAGKAANIIAEQMGYSAEQIRRDQLSFNQLPVLRDTNGNLRQMFRFGKEFSNSAIRELRANEKFRPTPVATVSAFSEGAERHVSLTAPLDLLGDDSDEADEADEEISPNMSSFLHTLKPGTEH